MITSLFGWMGSGAPFGGGGAAPKENRIEAQSYGEYGLTDRLTLLGQISAERYALTAPSADVYRGLDYANIGLRARLYSNEPWTLSAQATLFAPGARDATRPAQMGNTGGTAELRLLGGYNFNLGGTPGFVDGEIGYRLRAAGPPSEWHGDATLGLRWTPKVMALFQLFNTFSQGGGAPGFPAWRSSVAQASLVYALDEHWSVQLGAFATLATVNTNSQRGAIVAVWRRF